jgi:hypothetical protein
MSKLLDTNLSIEIAKRIKPKASDCFRNAYQAALIMPEAIYVQGFLAFAGEPYMPVEYSWIELDDCLVDPTFSYLHKNPEELHYFPAQRLTIKQLKAAIEEAQEDYPEDEPLPIYGDAPYEYYGDVMLGGHDYQAAFLEAEAKCQELNQYRVGSQN